MRNKNCLMQIFKALKLSIIKLFLVIFHLFPFKGAILYLNLIVCESKCAIVINLNSNEIEFLYH